MATTTKETKVKGLIRRRSELEAALVEHHADPELTAARERLTELRAVARRAPPGGSVAIDARLEIPHVEARIAASEPERLRLQQAVADTTGELTRLAQAAYEKQAGAVVASAISRTRELFADLEGLAAAREAVGREHGDVELVDYRAASVLIRLEQALVRLGAPDASTPPGINSAQLRQQRVAAGLDAEPHRRSLV